ncbi:hypothetical protein H6802_02730 [Candidatus Nomurabacteria bacterium]|nr:hypothetical protein [Candidatus Nomurabacteria bacterium]MCB9827170.1 hypothetical protein [Candidatus Nomurabacteria bacterium]MCB9827789.1 hypothetical protein [Candidatus Nomurabacteria bacterium]
MFSTTIGGKTQGLAERGMEGLVADDNLVREVSGTYYPAEKVTDALANAKRRLMGIVQPMQGFGAGDLGTMPTIGIAVYNGILEMYYGYKDRAARGMVKMHDLGPSPRTPTRTRLEVTEEDVQMVITGMFAEIDRSAKNYFITRIDTDTMLAALLGIPPEKTFWRVEQSVRMIPNHPDGPAGMHSTVFRIVFDNGVRAVISLDGNHIRRISFQRCEGEKYRSAHFYFNGQYRLEAAYTTEGVSQFYYPNTNSEIQRNLIGDGKLNSNTDPLTALREAKDQITQFLKQE